MEQYLNDYRIRQAIDTDTAILTQIWLDAFLVQFQGKEVPTLDENFAFEQTQNLIHAQDDTFKLWVCIDDKDEVLGYSTTQPLWPTQNKDIRNSIGFIMTYVNQKYKGHGIGDKLFTHNMWFCKNHTKLTWCLGFRLPTNKLSVSITDKAGYQTIGQFPSVQGAPEWEIIMLPLK